MPSANSTVEDTIVPRPADDKITEETTTVWEQLSKLPDFDDFIEGRIQFYQDFLPTGDPIPGLSEKERQKAWANAVVLIRELKTIRNTVKLMTKKDG